MTNESNRPAHEQTETASDLKASDFFPPGSGWNKAADKVNDKTVELPVAQGAPADLQRH